MAVNGTTLNSITSYKFKHILFPDRVCACGLSDRIQDPGPMVLASNTCTIVK